MFVFDRICIAATLLIYVAGAACMAEYIFSRSPMMVGITTLAAIAVGVLGSKAIASEGARRRDGE